MLKRTTAVAIAMLIAITAGPVAAQTCSVGVYSDADASGNLVSPIVGEPFDVYVILLTEGLANAAGYTLVAGGSQALLPIGASYGFEGIGINIPNDGQNPFLSGQNVGLGECAIGFGGTPLIVAKYSFLALTADGQASFTVTGNPESSSLDPAFPVVSDCQGILRSCDVGPALTVELPVSSTSESFGAVKGLYRN